jgi:hypothetical protein
MTNDRKGFWALLPGRLNMSILHSKKFWVSALGLTFAILAANGHLVPQDVRAQVLELIMAIVGAFNVGQGIADGVSGGRTSGVAIKANSYAK